MTSSPQPSNRKNRPLGKTVPAALLLPALIGLGISIVVAPTQPESESEIDYRPIELVDSDYVSSRTCQACHPSEYNSWYGSFHRTMTQVATPDTVRADFDGVQVENVHGRPMNLEEADGQYWAEFDDPNWDGPVVDRPRIRRKVVMITGSHHQNIYWYATGHDRSLNVLPGVYLIAEEQWAPRSSVVLHPPGQSLAMLDGHWNAICIVCHTTLGKTAFDTPFQTAPIDQQRVDTTVTEFGIACESCHGPAKAHIAANRNPLQRYGLHLAPEPDTTIVLPTRLDPKRSSQVCGQCHSVWEFYNTRDERQANSHGLPYRPGAELRDTRFIAQPSVDRTSPHIQTLVANDPEFVRGSFWPDGMIRVSGREYNGLLDSPCYNQASSADRTLTCFSCHSMHKSPDDPRSVSEWADTNQVSNGMESDAACLQCHSPIETNLTAHTKHSTNSSGSRCYNCHMPYTSYGLLKTVRSHTVTSPTATETAQLGRPNACNLCHLDKTLAWTSEWLNRWFDTPPPPLTEEDETVAASLLWLLRGDGGLRAITAQSMGWKPAQEVSGTSWMVPHLGEALGDPYDAVRFIAARSLRSLPSYTNLDFDFVSPRQVRIEAAIDLLRSWRNSGSARNRRDPELLLDENGELRLDLMRQLFDARDQRGLFLRE